MREHQATLGRRPRIPSLFSTISINKPHGLPTTRGRAYKPAQHPRQHTISDADDENLPVSTVSNCVGAIVKHHGVLGFGKKQPALGDEPQRRGGDSETCREHPDHAADEQCE